MEIPTDFSRSYPELTSPKYLITPLLILKGTLGSSQNLSLPRGKSLEWWSPDTKTQVPCKSAPEWMSWVLVAQAGETLFEARSLQKLQLHFSHRKSSCICPALGIMLGIIKVGNCCKKWEKKVNPEEPKRRVMPKFDHSHPLLTDTFLQFKNC